MSSLAERLERLSDDEIRDLVLSTEPQQGWGASHVVELDGTPVFVKRIPVTDRELDTPGTKNVFDLPLRYNYGLGSPGLGAFRELEALRLSTRWVLDGETVSFPVLHHHRIVPQLTPGSLGWPGDAEYLARWGNDPAIDAYMVARHAATSEIVVFLEHVPHVAHPWLLENGSRIDDAIGQLFDAITLMRSKGMIHFDAHLFNVVTEGTRFVVVDFGLALDDSFDLTPDEREFRRRHEYYDYGLVLMSIGSLVTQAYESLDETDRLAIRRACDAEDIDEAMFVPVLIQRIDKAHGTGLLPLASEVVDAVVRYSDVIMYMGAFVIGMRLRSRRDPDYDDERCRELLIASGAL